MTRLTNTQLVTRYAGFAVLATVANLAAQRVSLAAYDGGAGSLALAIGIGTGGVGLVLKYILDKRWIFFDLSTGGAGGTHGRKFGLYTLMGVLTTAIFWGGAEAGGAWAVWGGTEMARELGGAVAGLAVGYLVKYRLDKRFVFGGVQDAI